MGLSLKLVPDWREAYRWLSVQGAALGLMLIGAWNTVPEELRAALPTWLVATIAVIVLLGVILGRLVDQKQGGKIDV